MAKTDKAMVPTATQEARWALQIGRFRTSARWRSTALANLTLGLGASMVLGSVAFLVKQAAAARYPRRKRL